jgi:hypothetical protein
VQFLDSPRDERGLGEDGEGELAGVGAEEKDIAF